MTDQREDLVAEVITIAVEAMAILRAIKEDLAVMRGDLADMRRRAMEGWRGGSVMKKIGLSAVLVALAAPAWAVDLVLPGNNPAPLDAQFKCRNAATAYVNSVRDPEPWTYGTRTFLSHYNTKLNRCIAAITTTGRKHEDTKYELIDVVEGHTFIVWKNHSGNDWATKYNALREKLLAE